MSLNRRTFLVVATCALANPVSALAAKPRPIELYVKDMHCQTCAKKIASKLYEIPGVVKVSTDVKKGLAVIVPEQTRQPSPKAMWEAVEAATFEPIKLACSSGTYTQKPKR